ncbi:hypothetical protein DFO70_10952 [Cytobacillus firmus]|uniref:Uncharacterized protein n=2 Tax=Cytobacillus TaxID=2675230 RepID=A0A366JQG8_CYTFI|nr:MULTISPECIES: hypothetical protein [Cytobacillus]RBP90547.1 hypothetical protein DFO70_10952 [Cytobacillus firmus]TDX46129.1 hypothetical protein DFO72_102609 [Cytobacillus oceanisediminis]
MLRNHTPNLDSQIQQKITELKSELAKYQSMLSPSFKRDDSTEGKNNIKQITELINKNDILRKKLASLSEENKKQSSYLHILQKSVYELHNKELTEEFFIKEDKDLIYKLESRIYELELAFWEMHCKIENLERENERLIKLPENENTLHLFHKSDSGDTSSEIIVLKEEKRLEQLVSIETNTVTAFSNSTLQKKFYDEAEIINPLTDRNIELERAIKLLEGKILSLENKMNHQE